MQCGHGTGDASARRGRQTETEARRGEERKYNGRGGARCGKDEEAEAWRKLLIYDDGGGRRDDEDEMIDEGDDASTERCGWMCETRQCECVAETGGLDAIRRVETVT